MALEADQLELYAQFGIASEAAQVLEVEAGNVALAFVALFVDTSRIGADERQMFRQLVDDVNRKTLGALLRSIKTWVNFDDALLRTVDDALERRNYLAHRFFPRHNFAIFDSRGRAAMIAELKDIQVQLETARAALQALSSALLKFGGHADLSEEQVLELLNSGKSLRL